ncbi:MAG: hypothetical protein RIS54_2206 [Verrucomicrobiota bacterium]|jgi:lipopolysaccharide heptosyltransferase II
MLLQTAGWTVAHTPEILLRAVAVVLGEAVLTARRRSMLSNLHHAFPERDLAELRALARASAQRLIETALFSLATPYLAKDRVRQMVQVTPETVALITQQQTAPTPVLLATPHFAYWETLAFLGLVTPPPFPEIGTIFRPIDNPVVNDWVKACREQHGLRLLSRKDGFQEALRILRRNGTIMLLFDQNAGLQGALATLFGRVCSTTELAGLLVQKFAARTVAIYPVRTAFWRVELHVEDVPTNGTVAGVTIALNRWLENKLSTHANLCASWLWAHARWKNQDMPAKRLRLESKRNLLAEDLAARGLATPPRKTSLWLRLPNWLGDVVMLIPLLRAIRAGRPDAELMLVGKAAFAPFLESAGLADRFVPLPARGRGYFPAFLRLRHTFADFALLFTNSVRGDLEAWLAGVPQRFGLVRPGRRRPLLTHRFLVPAEFDETRHHQLELWTNYLTHFGLKAPADFTPLATPVTNASLVVGLIAGSENNPEKRWPVPHWCELIDRLPANAKVVLFGTATDRAITDEIAARCGRQVDNLAGRTNLREYCDALQRCTVLVTNDTGGMHLANALGVPLIALFGPTNPVRTRPVFAAPVTILQPPGCPATGGGTLVDLTPTQVETALTSYLTRTV